MQDNSQPTNPSDVPLSNQSQPEPSTYFMTQPETPVLLRSPNKKKKLIIIIAAAIVLMIGVVLGGLFLRTEANKSADTYKGSVSSHLKEIFAEVNYAKRLELLKKEVTLNGVFAGTVLSDDYKRSKDEIKPLYQAVLNDGITHTQMTLDYNSFVKEIIVDIQKVLADASVKVDIRDKKKLTREGTKDIEAILVAMLEKADRLDGVATKVEGMEIVKKYEARDELLANIRNMAESQRNVVRTHLEWMGDLTTVTLPRVELYKQTILPTTEGFDGTGYQATVDDYIFDYKVASRGTVNSMTSIVDELQKEAKSDEMTSTLKRLNDNTQKLADYTH